MHTAKTKDFIVALLKFLSEAFSQRPTQDKLLTRTIGDLQPQRIVQLGLGDGRQSLEMIDAAQKHQSLVAFCGIDLFEASPPDQPHLSLRDAHRKFAALPVEARLIPGDPNTALRRWANELTNTDLVVVTRSVTCFDTIWNFAPRMLVASSRVLIETDGDLGWKTLTPTDISCEQRRSAA